MTITAIALTRAAGVAAVAAGVIFIGVQIGHPQLNATTITTTNVYVRDQLKVISAARQRSPSDDMRSIGDDENAAALKAWGGQLTPHSLFE